ncbi:MAG: RnfH family protein [Burkholderiaceae bacterium]|jgi:putative ubiquitin-RnfH superfamily antitoxin RatB of RatAB toxin-antitoxin module|nr:RnfH family protein [Burkholderiaceae bacterium]
MRVELAWVGEGGEVLLRALELPAGATVGDALDALGDPLTTTLRERIRDDALAVAVYGKSRPLENVLKDGDRIELVGSLLADPRTARRMRVQQRRAEGGDPRWKRR